MGRAKFAFGALIGAAVGVAVGVLTAPKSGKETRAKLGDRAKDLKTKSETVLSETESTIEKVVKDVEARMPKEKKF